jgi:non-heme chloroperoxidase
MTHIQTRDGTRLYTLDWGTGDPLVLVHGWPLSSRMWEYQMAVLPHHGIRCIAYDRRGFGRSSQPWNGYDYDTLADDLATVLETLDLHDVTLLGFSMGGGEVARYMSRHQGKRVARVVLVGSVTPFLRKTDDHPEGVDQSVFDGVFDALGNDRPGFLTEFSKVFFGFESVMPPVTNAVLSTYCEDAMRASGHATLACARAWSSTDFRKDLPHIKVPALVIHGDQDANVPMELTSRRTAALIPGAELKVYEGAPHGLYFTHKHRLNADIAAFMGKSLG